MQATASKYGKPWTTVGYFIRRHCSSLRSRNKDRNSRLGAHSCVYMDIHGLGSFGLSQQEAVILFPWKQFSQRPSRPQPKSFKQTLYPPSSSYQGPVNLVSRWRFCIVQYVRTVVDISISIQYPKHIKPKKPTRLTRRKETLKPAHVMEGEEMFCRSNRYPLPSTQFGITWSKDVKFWYAFWAGGRIG